MPAGKVAAKVQQALGNRKVLRGKNQIDKFNTGVAHKVLAVLQYPSSK